MSLATGKQDLFGNLVVSGSTELNIPVGVNITNNTGVTSAAITLPNAGTNLVLCKMPSGTCTVALSIYTTVADFASPTDTATSLTGIPLFLKGDNTAGQFAKIRITNTSGGAIAPTQLVFMPLVQYVEGVDLLSGNRGNAAAAVNSTHNTPDGSSGSGAFVLTAGN